MIPSRFLLAFAVGGFLLITAAANAAPIVGDPAPALIVPRLDGRLFDLSALRGKIVVVNFWATWCVPCRLEMPRLDSFYRRYYAYGLELIGISADRPRDRSAVPKVMAAFTYPAAILSDATINRFGAPTVLPITYVIGPDQVVRAKLIPESDTGITDKQLTDAVLPLLPHNAAPTAP